MCAAISLAIMVGGTQDYQATRACEFSNPKPVGRPLGESCKRAIRTYRKA